MYDFCFLNMHSFFVRFVFCDNSNLKPNKKYNENKLLGAQIIILLSTKYVRTIIIILKSTKISIRCTIYNLFVHRNTIDNLIISWCTLSVIRFTVSDLKTHDLSRAIY